MPLFEIAIKITRGNSDTNKTLTLHQRLSHTETNCVPRVHLPAN